MFEEFKIKDFAASPELVNNMSATLEWVENSLPEEAATHLSMRRIGQKYTCKLDVFTKVGHFNGVGLFASPQGAFDQAVSQLMGLLRHWRQERMTAGVSSHLADSGLNGLTLLDEQKVEFLPIH